LACLAKVLSLRRLLLKAPPLLAHLRAQVARHQPSDVALGDTAVGPTTSVGSLATSRRRLGLISALNVHKWLPGHKPNREHILYSQSNESASLLNQLPETHVAAIDGLRSYSSNLRSNHERSSNSDEFNSNSHSGSRSSDSLKDGTGRSTGTGRRPGRSGDDVFHDLQLDPAIKRLWSLPASIDILVIERTRTRSLVNHAALVDALQHWAPPVDAPQVGEGGLGGQAGRVSSTSSDWLPLTLRVFSDRSSTAKRARTEGHSSSSSGENDSGAWSSQAEVLALFASAAVVIAPHGAGLANMLVMRYAIMPPSNSFTEVMVFVLNTRHDFPSGLSWKKKLTTLVHDYTYAFYSLLNPDCTPASILFVFLSQIGHAPQSLKHERRAILAATSTLPTAWAFSTIPLALRGRSRARTGFQS